MRFNILGPLEVVHDNAVYTPTAPKARQTLALLLSRAGQLVDTATMIDELWGDRPPRSAVTTTQTYVYQLRKIFSRSMGEEAASRMLITQPPGYCLRLDDDQLDARDFHRLAEQGNALIDQGRPQEGSRRLREALSLWRGSVLPDIAAGPILEAHIVHLQESRIRTLELSVQADLQLGRHRELVPELRSLVTNHPMNESFHAQLITSLKHAGRRGEALQAYQALQRILRDELGLEPSKPVQSLLMDLLHGR